MSGLFSSPSAPAAPATPPPPPTMANSQGATNEAALAQAQALQRGRSSTILTGGGGLPTDQLGNTSKVLLGS